MKHNSTPLKIITFLQVKRISKTEDQVKDDLIKEKLISNKLMKMKSKMSRIAKMRMKKERGVNATSEVKGELSVIISNAVDEQAAEVKEDLADSEELIAKKEDLIAKKIKKKKEAWQVSDSKTEVRNGVSKSDPSKNATANGEITHQEKKLETKDHKVRPPLNKTARAKRIISNAKRIAQKNDLMKSKFRPVTREKSQSNGRLRAPDKKGKNSQVSQQSPVEEKDVDEDEDVDDGVVEEEETDSPPLLSRSTSQRKKRARKIFDPADHDLPTRPVKKSRLSGEDEVKEELNQTKENKEVKEGLKELKELKGSKDGKDLKQSREGRDPKQSKENIDVKPSKEIKEIKPIKEAKDTKQSKDTRETRFSKENKENKETKDTNVFKTPSPSPIEGRGSRQGSRRKVKTLVEPPTDQVSSKHLIIYDSQRLQIKTSGKQRISIFSS